jgi:hypothetical protein
MSTSAGRNERAGQVVGTPRRLWLWSFTCLAVGVVAFGAGLALAPGATWGALLGNLLFWAGAAGGGLAAAASFRLSEAHWSRPVERFAVSLGMILPFALLALPVLWFGQAQLFPQPGTGWHLLRDALALAVTTGIGFAFLRFGPGVRFPPGGDGNLCRDERRLPAAMVIAFFLSHALIAADLDMAPEPGFHSSVYPVVYLAGSFYSALALIAALAAMWRRMEGADSVITRPHLLDLGNLVWGMALFLGYLWWCDYFPAWMANLPEEARRIITRWRVEPWDILSWNTLACAVVIPGVLLASRALKQNAAALAAVCCVGALGVLLQRLTEVLPLVRESWGPLPVLVAVGVCVGSAGLAGLTVLWFILRVPPVPAGDPEITRSLVLRQAGVP